MNLIKVPETAYTNYSDKMKFDLTWKINIFIFGTNLILLPILFFLAFDEFIGLLASSTLALIYQIILYKTRRFEVIAVVWVIVGIFSTAISLFLVPSLMHVTDIIFMFMVIAYAFFTLGRFAGILSTISIMLTLTTYFIFKINQDPMSFSELSTIEIVKSCIISIYGLTITSYIIFKYAELTQYSTEKFISANKQLEFTNTLIEQKNQEKTVMLKEIHHRVKNNLQVITSLLRLQSSEDFNEQNNTEDLFNEAISRVAAMSLIHEKMYQSEDLSELDFNNYLISLTEDLIDSYSVTKNIQVDVKAPPLDLANKHVVPVALLCNELISNSLKHAFDNSKKGKIEVIVDICPKTSKYELKYSDSGQWKEPTSPHSFGMELIDSLSQQLNGSYERHIRDNGTYYKFEFENLSN